MKIQIIEGNFTSKDALEILTNMIHVKIKYHENKINEISNEEDINMRETRIKRLQKDLFDVKNHIEKKGCKISIQSSINID